MKRRRAIKTLGVAGVACLTGARAEEKEKRKSFEIDYVLASALYGNMKLATIVPEVARAGAVGLDIWGKPHGTQREELDEMGIDAFAAMVPR